ncbi:hypothetical protein VH1709_contig00183-0002 [Vibrio harveyi]|nr:hypothetical protein VH1709_contig00183-0002 [Vibrio harveyi]
MEWKVICPPRVKWLPLEREGLGMEPPYNRKVEIKGVG